MLITHLCGKIAVNFAVVDSNKVHLLEFLSSLEYCLFLFFSGNFLL